MTNFDHRLKPVKDKKLVKLKKLQRIEKSVDS